jgi:hypothetical protein
MRDGVCLLRVSNTQEAEPRDVYCGGGIRLSGRGGAIGWLWLSAAPFSIGGRSHEKSGPLTA